MLDNFGIALPRLCNSSEKEKIINFKTSKFRIQEIKFLTIRYFLIICTYVQRVITSWKMNKPIWVHDACSSLSTFMLCIKFDQIKLHKFGKLFPLKVSGWTAGWKEGKVQI